MITPRLAGWERRALPSGILWVAPEGQDAGAISIAERFEAPVSLVDLAAARGQILGGPTPITGGDGQVIAVERPGGREDIGLVLGDVHFTVIVGVTALPEHFERTRAAVEELTRHVAVAMTVRRRRFVYPAPPGWTAICRGFETEWYPPGFESDPARLTVFPAVEHRGAGAPDTLMSLIEQQLDVSSRFADAEWRESMTRTGSELSFLRSIANVGGRITELAVAVDAEYVYAFRLEGGLRHRPVLDAALAGVVPLVPAEAPSLSAVSHWTE